MPDNQQNSLFTELTDRESGTVSGGSTISGFSSSNSNSDTKKNSSSNGVNTLFFVPQPSQLFLYDPIRDRPYKTLVV